MGRELFGTDGIRGVPGVYPLDDATIYRVGRALGAYLSRSSPNPRVLLGMDTRQSGPHIAGEIAAGLSASGAQISSAGVITTPGVACLVKQKGFSAGIIISASHNPYTDNGIKLCSASGMKLPDGVETDLEKEILAASTAPGPEARVSDDPSLDAAYLDFLLGLKTPGAKLTRMKLVLDCANGAAYKLGPELFSSLGAEVVSINCEPDGRNINANCGSLYPEALQQRVVAEHAAMGVAFDGDADRALFVTSAGKLVDGDGVLLAQARYMKSQNKLATGRVIGTTMANLGLERALEAEKISLARVPVGDRYVLEEMLRSGANLGGEQSGHIIFLDDATTGDGILTALKMACLVALRGPLEQLVSGLKTYPQTIVNVKVTSKPPLESLPQVAQALREAELALQNSGRVVLRYSGTEPKARVMVEAEKPEDVQRWAAAIASAIESAIGMA
jgi:phosphoglucosamine mutase